MAPRELCSPRYEGRWVEGQRTGQGVWLSNMTKSRFEGQFRNGKKDGFGVLTKVNGKSCEGFWEADSYIGPRQ